MLDYSSIDNILIKVIILNNRYRTRLNDSNTDKKGIMPSVTQVAECILKYENKGRFSNCGTIEQVVELVEDFRKEFIDNNEPYSFITKYCSFRLPDLDVPIVDGYVKGLLYYYQFSDEIDDSYSQPKFGEYKEFCNAYDSFIKRHRLCELEYNSRKLTIKDIDKYLWLYAKEKEKEWVSDYRESQKNDNVEFSIAI